MTEGCPSRRGGAVGRRAALALGALALVACAPVDETREPVEALWPTAPVQRPVQEPVDFRARSAEVRYGLPPAGSPGLADLIALMPSEGVGRDEVNLWISNDISFPTDQCQGGGPDVLDALPMTLEVVVVLHPRQYTKVPVCGQDERNYGTYVVADDTGGIAVLRDARTEPFTFGDRLRMTVRGLMQSFGDPGSRFILIAEVERLPTPLVDGVPDRPVLYEPHPESAGPFGLEHIGSVRRVEGYVIVSPSNDNFNDLIIASRPPPALVSAADADRVCQELCRSRCNARCVTEGNFYCVERICPALCQAEGARVQDEDLPVCWATSVDVELGRRGFGAAAGRKVALTGPVVRGFRRQNLWFNRLGQIEWLEAQAEDQ